MKFIAIIPARYASTRFPGKPLADILAVGPDRGDRLFQRCHQIPSKGAWHSVLGVHLAALSPTGLNGKALCPKRPLSSLGLT